MSANIPNTPCNPSNPRVESLKALINKRMFATTNPDACVLLWKVTESNPQDDIEHRENMEALDILYPANRSKLRVVCGRSYRLIMIGTGVYLRPVDDLKDIKDSQEEKTPAPVAAVRISTPAPSKKKGAASTTPTANPEPHFDSIADAKIWWLEQLEKRKQPIMPVGTSKHAPVAPAPYKSESVPERETESEE